jgi:hypothetical protein
MKYPAEQQLAGHDRICVSEFAAELDVAKPMKRLTAANIRNNCH